MKLPISQEKGPIGRKCEHWASFLSKRNRLSNGRENLFPGGYGLSLLDSLSSWSRLNGLSLNGEKCNIISFTCSKNTLSFAYSIDDANFERVDKVKDLGIIFDSILTFAPHIEYIISKSTKMLGFVKRVTTDFRDINCILYLYKTLILTNMTYCSQIWSRFTNIMINKLESVQHILLLRYVVFKMHRPSRRFEHNYSEILEICNLQTIKSPLLSWLFTNIRLKTITWTAQQSNLSFAIGTLHILSAILEYYMKRLKLTISDSTQPLTG